MYASDTVTAAGRSWRAAANALIFEAQRISPLQEGILSAEGSDDESAQVAQRIDEQITAMLEAGDQAVAELLEPAASSADARFQATSLLVYGRPMCFSSSFVNCTASALVILRAISSCTAKTSCKSRS